MNNKYFEDQTEVYIPIVYICSPYSGDISKNTMKARRYCRFTAMSNCIPLAPYLLYPQFLDETIECERELGISFGLKLLDHCSEVWVFGERISTGMALELERAAEKKMRIHYFKETCEEVNPKCR